MQIFPIIALLPPEVENTKISLAQYLSHPSVSHSPTLAVCTAYLFTQPHTHSTQLSGKIPLIPSMHSQESCSRGDLTPSLSSCSSGPNVLPWQRNQMPQASAPHSHSSNCERQPPTRSSLMSSSSLLLQQQLRWAERPPLAARLQALPRVRHRRAYLDSAAALRPRCRHPPARRLDPGAVQC